MLIFFYRVSFDIWYIHFKPGSLPFIEIWSAMSYILTFPLYHSAFKSLRHELNIEQSY